MAKIAVFGQKCPKKCCFDQKRPFYAKSLRGTYGGDSLIKKIEKVLDVELMIESQAANSRQTINQGSRNMTIGDAYEELFSGRE